MAKKKTASKVKKKATSTASCPLSTYCVNNKKKCNDCISSGKGKKAWYKQKRPNTKGSIFNSDDITPLY